MFSSVSNLTLVSEFIPFYETFQIVFELTSGNRVIAFLTHNVLFSQTQKTTSINIQSYENEIKQGKVSLKVNFPISAKQAVQQDSYQQKQETRSLSPENSKTSQAKSFSPPSPQSTSLSSTSSQLSSTSSPSGFCGLNNPGNLCFMNSYMQVMYHIPAFQKMILSCNVSSPLISSVKTLFSQMNQYSRTATTVPIAAAVGIDFKNFVTQFDVHEFSRIFISALESETKSPFLNKFYGKMKTIFQGKPCGESPFSDINITVQTCSSIPEGIRKFMKESELENKMKLTYSFSELPEIIHIHLNRFIWNKKTESAQKLNKYIQCPKALNLRDFCETSLQSEYSLYAVLIHVGGCQSGHYWVELNYQMKNKWVSFNDASYETISNPIVDTRTSESPLSPSPYLLIYVRKDTIPSLFS